MSQPHSIYEYITKQLRKYIMKGWSLKILKIKLRKVLFLYQKKNFYSKLYQKKKKSIRSSCPEVFLRKGILKICSKFTGEHSCQSANKMLCNFIEIALRLGCSPVNLLYIFRTPFLKYTSGQLLLNLLWWTVISLLFWNKVSKLLLSSFAMSLNDLSWILFIKVLDCREENFKVKGQ